MININNRDVRGLSCEEIGALAKLVEFQSRRTEFTVTLREIANILGFSSINKTRKVLESLVEKGKISMVGEATQKKTFFIKDGASVYHKEANRDIAQEIEQKRATASVSVGQPDAEIEPTKKSFFSKKIAKGTEIVNNVIDKAKTFLAAKDVAHEKLEKIILSQNKTEFTEVYLRMCKEKHGDNPEFNEQWAKKSANACWDINTKNNWRQKHGAKIPNLSKWVYNFILNETPERIQSSVGQRGTTLIVPPRTSSLKSSK